MNKQRSKFLQAVGKLGLVFASVLVAAILMELLLVIAGYNYSPMRVELGGGDARERHLFQSRSFIYDPDLIWRPKKGYSVFNSQGFRGPLVTSEKDPQSLRVFTLGDSNTLGWADAEGANWPQYLQELLRGVVDGASVINAGVWGYTSYQGVSRFKEVLDYNPDIILVSFGSNDAHRVAVSDQEFADRPIRKIDLDRTLIRFKLGQLLLATMDRFSGREYTELKPRVSLPNYRKNLTWIVDEATKRNIDVVFLTRPYIGGINNELWWKNFAHEYNQATVEVAEQHNVTLVDIFSFFKNKAELFADESHFNEQGHRDAAQILFEAIRPFLTR
jgi:lysophospholipase L1-like esterase